MPAGQIAGLIRSIVNVHEVIDTIIREAKVRLIVTNSFFREET
jgi:hypothetical protein